MPISELGRFILSEMKRRKMKEYAFAQFIGVAQSTINSHISEAAPKRRMPSLEFVEKLSDKTGVSMAALWPIAYPDRAGDFGTQVDPRILALAERLSELDESTIDLIFRLAESLEK